MTRTPNITRTHVNVGLAIVAVFLFLVTQCVESVISVVLPGAAIHWIISNEQRLASENHAYINVDWTTKATFFILLPAISLSVIAFWLPRHSGQLHPWAIYTIASFSLAFLLVNLYGRYLSLRKLP